MIVPMKPSHVPQIAALGELWFSDPWSEASVAGECENPLSLWLVAELDGKVAGYIGSQSVPPEADVLNLAVDPDCRRQGLGRKLLCTLTELLHSRGIETLSLEVPPTNQAALALYSDLGFVQVGRRPKYYVNPTEDALILRKEL